MGIKKLIILFILCLSAIGLLAVPRASAASAPTISNVSSSILSADNATISATIGSQGQDTSYWVEWGTTTAYGNQSIAQQLAAGPYSTATSIPLSGLPAGTLLHYRVVAINSSGTTRTLDGSFLTPTDGPAVGSVSVHRLQPTSAELDTTITTHGLATSYYASYGVVGQSETATAPVAIGSPNANYDTAVYLDLSGLQPLTPYRVEIHATNASGAAVSQTVTFTTPALPPPPVVTNVVASADPHSGAVTVSADVDPAGADTSVSLAYGETPFLGSFSSSQTVPGSGGAQRVTFTVQPLEDATIYYSVQAGSVNGNSSSVVASIASSKAAPTIGGISIGSITDTSATVSGAATFYFDSTTNYGVSYSYWQQSNGHQIDRHDVSACDQSTSPLSACAQVSKQLTGLEPSTTYFVQATATEAGHSSTSAIESFTTAAAPGTPPSGQAVPTKAAITVKIARADRSHLLVKASGITPGTVKLLAKGKKKNKLLKVVKVKGDGAMRTKITWTSSRPLKLLVKTSDGRVGKASWKPKTARTH